MASFQPPPTYTSPIITNPAAEREEDKVAFSPIWLNWFLQLAGIINSLGAGGGIPISSLDPSGGTEDQVIKINGALTGFDFASPSYAPFVICQQVFGP